MSTGRVSHACRSRSLARHVTNGISVLLMKKTLPDRYHQYARGTCHNRDKSVASDSHHSRLNSCMLAGMVVLLWLFAPLLVHTAHAHTLSVSPTSWAANSPPGGLDLNLDISHNNAYSSSTGVVHIQTSSTGWWTGQCRLNIGSSIQYSSTTCPATVTPGTYGVWVNDNAETSNTVTYTVYYPTPSLASLSPSSASATGAAFTLTVNGSNFFTGAAVQWDGVSLSTTFVSATQLTASVDASRIATTGNHTITVIHPSPNQGSSAGLTFAVVNPPPTVSAISPTSTTAPGAAFTLTVIGSDFTGSSVINWNGTALTTTVASATQMTAVIPAGNVATAGTVIVTAVTPAPGGGTSPALTFTIDNPAPTASSVSPALPIPGISFTLTVTGTNFVPGSVIRWNGVDRLTTYASATQLTSQVSGAETASGESATITVFSSGPGGGVSNSLTLAPSYPAPAISAITPTSVNMGSGDLTVTATGSGFYAGPSTIQWNGTNLTTTYVSPTQLTAVIPAANLVGPDTVNLTIFTGGPGGGASIAKSFTILPTLSVGPLTQSGWNVTAAVMWPTTATVTNQVTDCGTTTTQTFTGPTGTCVYPKAGAFTITGTSTVGGTPNVQGPTQAVTIPLIVPTTATLSATVNGLQPASDGTIAPFHFPASTSTAITLVRPTGVGIVDPLDLNVSRLAITPSGGMPSNVFVRTGADALQTTATGQLDAAATYTLQLNGQTVSGGGVTGSLTLIVAQGSPVLILGNLVQDGFNVLMTVSWPNDLQGAVPVSINCGTSSTQLITGATVACQYTTADTFQLRGSYKSPETGTPTLQTTPQSATIPPRVPIGADLSFAVNNVPVSGASVTAYRLPAIVKSTVTLKLPQQIGIIDPLDVGPSRLNIGRIGGSTTAYRLSLGTNQTLTTNLSSFDTPGDYTISLQGQTVKGSAVSATQTLTVTAADTSLILGNLVQDGDNVAVSVTWPNGITPVAVNCGTSSLQTFIGPAGACSYNHPGSFQITGTFVNPEDNSNLAAAPATVTIPAIAPVNPQIALQVNNQPTSNSESTNSASTYRVPSLLKAIITMQRPAGIGVLDLLDTQNSAVSVIPDGMAPTHYRPIVRNDPLQAVANGELRRAGPHTIAFNGKTLGGQTLSASASLIVEIGKATLQANPPAQDGNAVIVQVKWPDSGPTGTINCGFMSQTITAPSGTCRYTRAGSYQIVGFFSDPARGSTVLTDPVPVTIPLLAPTQASLSIVSVNSAGVSSNAAGSIPLFTTLQPQSYPVNVRLKVTFTRPNGIGVLDVIDRSRSSLTATPIADGASPILVAISLNNNPLELTALASLRSFSSDPTDPSHWRYQFTFTGQSLGGSTYSTQAELVGSIGGPSPITLQVSRATPSIPYAPATYQYSLTGARSATLGEPLATAWTVTPDGQPPGKTVQNSRMMVTFEGPGTYQIQLVVRGPLSGSTTWDDTVIVPALAAADAPTIVTRVPEQNRPPAAYRFTVTTPPMADPRERTGVPTWTVEGTTVSTPALVTTFTTAGPHQVGVSVPTSYKRTLDAQTTVTVNPNQPPVGTVDCSRSSYRQLTKKYSLYCRATAADPDGRIGALKWNIPELQYERLDTTVMILERDQPVAITVELHITDNSGDETVVTVPIDMASLPVQ